MDAQYGEYLLLLGELGKTLDKLAETAQIKISAVRCDDLIALNDCIKQEQALSLGLRNLERRRGELLEGMKLSGITLSKTAESFPNNLRRQAAEVAESVRVKYNTYVSASESARVILESALHQIEKMLPTEQYEAEPNKLPSAMSTDIRA